MRAAGNVAEALERDAWPTVVFPAGLPGVGPLGPGRLVRVARPADVLVCPGIAAPVWERARRLLEEP